MKDKLLTPKEIAQHLGLKTEETLAVWRCTNRYPELPFVKIGRLVRYKQSDLEKFLEVRTRGANDG